MKTENAHGITFRSEEFPLAIGDEFTLWSDQVDGLNERNTRHGVIPGRYVIETIGGTHDDYLTIYRIDHEAHSRWRVDAAHVAAILGEPWSEYKKAEATPCSERTVT